MSTHEASDGVESERQTRRRFLGAAAAAVTVASAGCSGLLGGGGGSSPDATVREFYSALNEGDAQAANALIHPNATSPEVTQEQAQQFSEFDLEVQSTEVVEQGDDRAVVRVNASVMGQSQSTQLELRTHEGEWKLWSSGV